MRPKTAIALLLALLSPALGQEVTDRSWQVVHPNYRYPQAVASVRDVDFRNLAFHFFGNRGQVVYSASLKNGLWRQKEAVPFDWVALTGLSYFDFSAGPSPLGEGGEPRFALAAYTWVSVGGSSTDTGVVQLYHVDRTGLVVVQQIQFDAQSAGAGATFDPGSRTLTLRAAHYGPRDARCCPSAQDVVTFRWTGRDFREAEVRTVPIEKPPARGGEAAPNERERGSRPGRFR
jgi:hypothetical protein